MHGHENAKTVIDRLSRAAGHMNAVKRMVEEGRDCSDVLIQIAAVRAELANAGKLLLKDHIAHCIADAVRENDDAAIEKLNGAIDKLL